MRFEEASPWSDKCRTASYVLRKEPVPLQEARIVADRGGDWMSQVVYLRDTRGTRGRNEFPHVRVSRASRRLGGEQPALSCDGHSVYDVLFFRRIGAATGRLR
ncbi:hypothetical protein MRX96_059621 [Rhipicephalus microplus]